MRIGRGEEQWERVFELCPNQGGVEGPRIFNVDYSASFHPPPGPRITLDGGFTHTTGSHIK